jgi:hypothetical protein
MADAFVVLHTGTHTGLWGAVEVAFAVAVLVAAVGLVAALLLRARRGSPGAGLAAAFPAAEGSEEAHSGEDGRPSLDRREG